MLEAKVSEVETDDALLERLYAFFFHKELPQSIEEGKKSNDASIEGKIRMGKGWVSSQAMVKGWARSQISSIYRTSCL